MGHAEQDVSRGHEGGDVQWATGSGTQEVERHLGAGQSSGSLAWVGTLSMCGEKKMG